MRPLNIARPPKLLCILIQQMDIFKFNFFPIDRKHFIERRQLLNEVRLQLSIELKWEVILCSFKKVFPSIYSTIIVKEIIRNKN